MPSWSGAEQQKKKKTRSKVASKREAQLAAALYDTMQQEAATVVSRKKKVTNGAREEVVEVVLDQYGPSDPSERLQFGYAPSNRQEAVTYHAMHPTANWIKKRRANYRTAILEATPLAAHNCEPFESVVKLKRHWERLAKLERSSKTAGCSLTDAEGFLEEMANRQVLRVEEGVLAPPPDSNKRKRSRQTTELQAE